MFIYKHAVAGLVLLAFVAAGLQASPTLKYSVQPRYTDEAQAQAIMGSVVISFEIDKEGKARNARVVRGLDAGLDKNALATLDGKPVMCTAKTEIRFALQ